MLRAKAVHQSEQRQNAFDLHTFEKQIRVVRTSGFFPIQQTRHWPGHDLASVLAHAPTERKCLGNNGNMLIWRVSLIWKQTETGVCFGISYRNQNIPAIVAIFPWKIRKGKSVRMLLCTRGQPNYVCICVSGGPFISFLLWRGDVHARHGSSACHLSVC